MVTILLKKIIDVLNSSFTSIKTKLAYMYEHIQPPAPVNPIITIFHEQLIADTSGGKTVNFESISNYNFAYLYVHDTEQNVTQKYKHNRIIELIPSQITGTVNFMMGYYWDNANINIVIDNTSVKCDNKSVNLWATLIVSNDRLFER
mgnify:CR=1 FL=1